MAEQGQGHRNIREQLILAGISEISQFGLQNFSVRRIAAACGVSCAAPYKHFKDRHSFIAAMIEYINAQWGQRQLEILAAYPEDSQRQLVEISMAYIRFLVENPHFRSIIMLKDEGFDAAYHHIRGQMTGLTRSIIGRYCAEVHMDEPTRRRKTYAVRSLIYGAALMFDNGELEYCEEDLGFVRDCIQREFDLP